MPEKRQLEREDEWRDGLKAGDEVAIQWGSYSDRYRIDTVDRTTKTQIVVNGMRYRRRDGYMIGKSEWSFVRLVPPTDKIRHAIHRYNIESVALRAIDEARKTLESWTDDELGELIKLCGEVKLRKERK